jgi:tetratricopeptide (TPR) repeat protein
LFLYCGCFPQTTLPVAPNPAPVVEAKPVTPEKAQAKRAPQPATCVALGNLELEAATENLPVAGKPRTEAELQALYETARKYFQQAMKTDPKCRDAHLGLARAYQGLENYDRAVAVYEKAESVFPKDAAFCYELGMCHARHKAWVPAIAELQKAVDLDPENRTYGNMYGFSLARAGRYDDSLAFFKKTVGEARAHYNVARMLVHAKQGEAAKQHLRIALQINPNLTEGRQLLAELAGPATPGNSIATVSLETYEEPARGVAGARQPAK